MPDDTRKHHPRLSVEERLVMRESEIDILLATIQSERKVAATMRRALQHIDLHPGVERDEIVRIVRRALAEAGC